MPSTPKCCLFGRTDNVRVISATQESIDLVCQQTIDDFRLKFNFDPRSMSRVNKTRFDWRWEQIQSASTIPAFYHSRRLSKESTKVDIQFKQSSSTLDTTATNTKSDRHESTKAGTKTYLQVETVVRQLTLSNVWRPQIRRSCSCYDSRSNPPDVSTIDQRTRINVIKDSQNSTNKSQSIDTSVEFAVNNETIKSFACKESNGAQPRLRTVDQRSKSEPRKSKMDRIICPSPFQSSIEDFWKNSASITNKK